MQDDVFERLGAFPSVSLTELIGLGGLLVVAPHPDDETLGCGGLIAQAVSNGRRVKVVIVSDGGGSSPRPQVHPRAKLVEMRRFEALGALQALGLQAEDVHFLQLRDGAIPESGAQSVAAASTIYDLAKEIGATRIAVTWRNENHPDHRACYCIVRQVSYWDNSIILLEYVVWGNSDLLSDEKIPSLKGKKIDISACLPLKKAAISLYKSQLTQLEGDDFTCTPLPSALIERMLRPYEAFILEPVEASLFQPIMDIHQIWLSDAPDSDAGLPPAIRTNVQSIRQMYPHAKYTLWDSKSLRKLIEINFHPEVLRAFDKLTPKAFKADLGRFCILSTMGGLYADLSIRALRPWNIPLNCGLASFRDYDLLSPSWTSIAIGLLWSLPGRREFEIAIEYILDNCENRFYGSNPLYPTGPVLFGRAAAAAMAENGQKAEADDQWIGLCKAITPDAEIKNVAFVAPDQTSVAYLAKDIGGDLSHLGASGTNNYNTIWRRRSVYGEAVQVWPFDDPALRITDQARLTVNGIEARVGASGTLTFGPYITLEPGVYRLTVSFTSRAILPRFVIEVSHDSGAALLHSFEYPGGDGDVLGALNFIFSIELKLFDIEFRTLLFGKLDASIGEIMLEVIS